MIPYGSIRTNAAFPNKYLGFDDTGKDIDIIEKGMSKRFYAACMAMQGLIQSKVFPSSYITGYDLVINEVTSTAFKYADEMLKQEGEK